MKRYDRAIYLLKKVLSQADSFHDDEATYIELSRDIFEEIRVFLNTEVNK